MDACGNDSETRRARSFVVGEFRDNQDPSCVNIWVIPTGPQELSHGHAETELFTNIPITGHTAERARDFLTCTSFVHHPALDRAALSCTERVERVLFFLRKLQRCTATVYFSHHPRFSILAVAQSVAHWALACDFFVLDNTPSLCPPALACACASVCAYRHPVKRGPGQFSGSKSGPDYSLATRACRLFLNTRWR